MTEARSIVRTAPYLPPEPARAPTVDPRSPVSRLGRSNSYDSGADRTTCLSLERRRNV